MIERNHDNIYPSGPARERVLIVLTRCYPKGISYQVLDRRVGVGSFEHGERLTKVVDKLIAEGLVATEYVEGRTQPRYRLVKADDQS